MEPGLTSSRAAFVFPVFGFTADAEMYGFDDLDELSTCGKQTLINGKQHGMELIDAAGNRWRVQAMRRTGGVGLKLGLTCFLAGVSRIEHDLERLAPVTLDEVKALVGRAVTTYPLDVTLGGETVEDRLFQVEAASSIAELQAMLGLDHFRAY